MWWTPIVMWVVGHWWGGWGVHHLMKFNSTSKYGLAGFHVSLTYTFNSPMFQGPTEGGTTHFPQCHYRPHKKWLFYLPPYTTNISYTLPLEGLLDFICYYFHTLSVRFLRASVWLDRIVLVMSSNWSLKSIDPPFILTSSPTWNPSNFLKV